MIVKTPGSQVGSPAAAEEGGEEEFRASRDGPDLKCWLR